MNERSDHEDRGLTPGERELEAALGALVPAEARGVDRDALMFEAGRRSVRGRLWVWRGAAGIAAAVALAAVVVPRGAENTGAGEMVIRREAPASGPVEREGSGVLVAHGPVTRMPTAPEAVEMGETLVPGASPSYLAMRRSMLGRNPELAMRWWMRGGVGVREQHGPGREGEAGMESGVIGRRMLDRGDQL